MSLRLAPLSAMAALVLLIAPAAAAVTPQRLTWEELPQLVGKQVSIPLYNGGAVAGRIREIQPDALLLDVSKTTSAAALPKGPMRVPRATLHVLDVHGKGFKYRVLGSALGFVAGAAGGVGAAISVQGGLFAGEHDGGAAVALVSVMAGVTAAGYALGNAADRHTTTIQVIH